MQTPLFRAGTIVMTPGVAELAARGIDHGAYLMRHLAGDWGDLCAEDSAENALALAQGLRLLSSYALPHNPVSDKLWIITEADRSVTTLLLPLEY